MAKSFIGINGFNPNDYAKFDNGINIYTHTKTGSVNEFTGNGPNGRALMTADVEAGDTFTVNGTPVTAYMGADDATGSMAGSAWNGKWVSFVTQSGVLNFSGGGTRRPEQNLVTYEKYSVTASESVTAKRTWKATATEPCICFVTGTIYAARGSYGSLFVYISKNEERLITKEFRTDSTASGASANTGVAVVFLNPGDYVQLTLSSTYYGKHDLVLNAYASSPLEFSVVS